MRVRLCGLPLIPTWAYAPARRRPRLLPVRAYSRPTSVSNVASGGHANRTGV